MSWNIILSVLLGLLLLYLAAVLILYTQQHRFIFFPIQLERNYQFQDIENFEEVVLDSSGNRYWHALHFKKENAKGIIFYLHGNTSNLQHWAEQAEDFRNLGYEVLMIDYPSFGKSRGILSERAINKMSKKGFEYCTARFSPKEIVILGRSLGTGPATTLATRVDSKLLILETPYTSVPDVASINWKIFPVNFLSRFRFNTLKKIGKTKCPVIIFHGTEDELIPYEMGVKVAAKKGKLITIEGAEHNNFCETQLYLNTLANELQ